MDEYRLEEDFRYKAGYRQGNVDRDQFYDDVHSVIDLVLDRLDITLLTEQQREAIDNLDHWLGHA